jgi:hypothetical protein
VHLDQVLGDDRLLEELPVHFLARPPEELFCPTIPDDDPTFEVDRYDRIKC